MKRATLTHYYRLTGFAAIITGGILSAFFAKTPSTAVMWASAYLVLVVGVIQIFLGMVVAKLVSSQALRTTYCAFALYNIGSLVVIAGTVMKYSGYTPHIAITGVGSSLFAVALALFGWSIRRARNSGLKTSAYAVVIVLLLSSLMGILLAGIKSQ